MRYVDSYNQIRELRKKLEILRTAYYNYEAHLPYETFNKIKTEIKETEKKIEFIENIRRANERVRSN